MLCCLAFILSEKMFDITLMDKFYLIDREENIPEEVKDAYFKFIMDFCTIISAEFRYYLHQIENEDQGKFIGLLTTSDEAYVFTKVKEKYAEAVPEMEDCKNKYKGDIEAWKFSKKRKTRSDALPTRVIEQNFTNDYRKIAAYRKNNEAYKLWTHIFFSRLLSNANKFVNKRNEKKPESTGASLPADDEDEIGGI